MLGSLRMLLAFALLCPAWQAGAMQGGGRGSTQGSAQASGPVSGRPELQGLSGAGRLEVLLDLSRPPEGSTEVRPVLTDAERLELSLEALALARTLRQARLEALALHQVGHAYYRIGQIPQSLEHYYRSREAYRALGDPGGEVKETLYLGHMFQFALSDLAKALDYYAKAQEMARQHRLAEGLGRSASAIADLHAKNGAPDRAAAAYVEAMQAYAQLDAYEFVMARGTLCCKLSQLALQMGDLGASERYLAQAEGIYEVPGTYREYGLSRTWIQRAGLLRRQGLHAQALAEFQRALAYRRVHSHASDQAMLVAEIGETQRDLGDLAASEAHYREALAMRQELKDPRGTAECLLGLGITLHKAGRLEEAQGRMQEALGLAEGHAFGPTRRDAYRALSELFIARGRPAEALRYRLLYDQWQEQTRGPRVSAEVLGIVHRYEREGLFRQITGMRRGLLIAGAILILGAVGVLVLWKQHTSLRRWAREALHHRDTEIRARQEELDRLRAEIREKAPEDRPKYAQSHLTEACAQTYLRKLSQIMDQEGAYREPEMSLVQLARRLNINTTYLSQILNQHLGMSVKDYLNGLRVQEARQLLLDPALAHRSATDIGMEVGFSSKSTFYKCFKQSTGCTPVEYRMNPPAESAPDPGPGSPEHRPA